MNAINTTLFPNLPFDFGKDLAAEAGLYSAPLVVVAHAAVPAQTRAEFIRMARSRPGERRVGSAGSAPVRAERVAGRLDAMFDPTPSSIDPLRAGQLRALAVTGRTPLAVLPEVPVVADDIPGGEAGSWLGLCAPGGIPRPRIEALNTAANDAPHDRARAGRQSPRNLQTGRRF